MMRLRQNFLRNDDGSISMIFAAAAAMLVGLIGMGVDYSRALSAKSAAQSAADSAALAAAKASHLSDAARQALALSIFNNNAKNNSFAKTAVPTVNVNGDFVSVTTNFSVDTTFSKIAQIRKFDLSISSKAENPTEHTACILALSGNKSDSFLVDGTTNFLASDCAVQVNSTHPQSMKASGSATAIADHFCTKGDIVGAELFTPLPRTGCRPLADPLAGLAEPTSASCPPGSKDQKVQQGSHTMSPGLYCGGLTVMAHADATFDPGVYIIKNGPLTFRSGSQSTGNGVTFYFVGNGAKMDVDGGASIDFKAPTSGTYAGVVFTQKPTANAGATSTINGGGNVKITGAVHFPTQTLEISGNGGLGQTSNAWAIIADKVQLKGNGQVRVKADFASEGLPNFVLPVIGGGGAKLIN